MAIDLFHGHRGRFVLCKYWKKKSLDPSELDNVSDPSGIFYARPENSQSDSEQEVGNFMFDHSAVTISTHDDIDIETNDIVSYRGKMWFVESVQRSDEWGKSEFEPKVRTYIGLRQ